MSIFPITNSRLPGISGFLKQNSMFRKIPDTATPNGPQLIKASEDAIKNGQYRAGDRFPTPREISESTGATLIDSLDTVNSLLRSRLVCQTSEGRLFICSSRR